jgi:hypothetical protein
MNDNGDGKAPAPEVQTPKPAAVGIAGRAQVTAFQQWTNGQVTRNLNHLAFEDGTEAWIGFGHRVQRENLYGKTWVAQRSFNFPIPALTLADAWAGYETAMMIAGEVVGAELKAEIEVKAKADNEARHPKIEQFRQSRLPPGALKG